MITTTITAEDFTDFMEECGGSAKYVSASLHNVGGGCSMQMELTEPDFRVCSTGERYEYHSNDNVIEINLSGVNEITQLETDEDDIFPAFTLHYTNGDIFSMWTCPLVS